jgi:hypothetical protein
MRWACFLRKKNGRKGAKNGRKRAFFTSPVRKKKKEKKKKKARNGVENRIFGEIFQRQFALFCLFGGGNFAQFSAHQGPHFFFRSAQRHFISKMRKKSTFELEKMNFFGDF